LLAKLDDNTLQENFPYAMASRRQMQNQYSSQLLLASYKAGDTVRAQKISNALRKDLEQQITYFNGLDPSKQGSLGYDNQGVQQLLQQINSMEQYFKNMPTIMNNETGNPVIKNNPATQLDSNVTDQMLRDSQVSDKSH
ncbi:MAG: hypothetical protein ABIP35_07020, partial [Ginsengibacter sp.]